MCVCVSDQESSASQSVGRVQAELDEERQRYQNLLREFSKLEQRYDNLQEAKVTVCVCLCVHVSVLC